MADAVSEGAEAPRTPAVVWVLALLVVGAVWFFWSASVREQTSDLERWSRTPLSIEEVIAIIEERKPASDRLGHALVQLQLQAAADVDRATDLVRLVPDLGRHADRDEPQLRRLLAAAVTMLPSEKSIALLRRLLRDEDGKVTLNAAIGLARLGDAAGADRLEDAIRGTRIEQTTVRRDLLHAFRRVAGKRHLELLRAELHRAELDGDTEAAGYCREALTRLE